ncbi:unnamed protein product [Porites lobata]|uniref:Tyr recombinase domain-containing protein n=1 Tax=Porites lobata TaxID=104759 RepID=A0ABN8QNJ3_9CNID|nr:unnamed protein product [Porites lobata]
MEQSIFVGNGRGTEWQPFMGIGNPAVDRSVKQYLAKVREEQLNARVVPHQAEPFLVGDLVTISEFIHARIQECPNSHRQPKLSEKQELKEEHFLQYIRARLNEYTNAEFVRDKLHVTRVSMGDRFTLHGFRRGAGISLALAGVSLHEIMDHVGRKNSRTALHYIKLKTGGKSSKSCSAARFRLWHRYNLHAP